MDRSVESQILIGEDSVWEFKSVNVPGHKVTDPDTKDMADELAAAANTSGATFLLGVNDKTRKVEGIPLDKLDVVETWLRDICNDSIKPATMAEIRKLACKNSEGEDRIVIRVNVPQSLFVHKSPHGYFYRIGSSKREMSPEYLARLFQQRSQTRFVCFDEQVVPTAEIKDLKRGLFGRFRTELSSADDREFLRKIHFIAPDSEGAWRPTVGGILMSSVHPEEFLPSAFIQAVCYRGTERNAADQVDAAEITGPLDTQVAEACRFVFKNMRVAAVKIPGRVDIPQFAMNAVFEAIVNAVAHRDYSISGAKIRIHLFADRLEVMSPGGLPNSLTLEEIGERQFSRNELICTCLSRCPLEQRFTDVVRLRLMDRRGEGVPVILLSSFKLSGKNAIYELLGDSELRLTIPSVPIDSPEKLLEIAKGLSTVSRRRVQMGSRADGLAKIRELISENPRVTQAQMAAACGVSRTCIANWLKSAADTIRREGSDNGGVWVLL